MPALKTFEELTAGASTAGSNSPSRWQLLLAGPPEGFVRIPLSLAIQCDSLQPYVTCHGRLEATDDGPQESTLDLSDFLATGSVYNGGSRHVNILWSLKLLPPVLTGGEYFIPVQGFPLIHGTLLVADWSYATPNDAVRTRAVSVDVPAASFDWSAVKPLTSQPQHEVSALERPSGLTLASLPLWPALWRHRRMRG